MVFGWTLPYSVQCCHYNIVSVQFNSVYLYSANSHPKFTVQYRQGPVDEFSSVSLNL